MFILVTVLAISVFLLLSIRQSNLLYKPICLIPDTDIGALPFLMVSGGGVCWVCADLCNLLGRVWGGSLSHLHVKRLVHESRS